MTRQSVNDANVLERLSALEEKLDVSVGRRLAELSQRTDRLDRQVADITRRFDNYLKAVNAPIRSSRHITSSYRNVLPPSRNSVRLKK